jgi:hypothetical protein
MRGRLSKLIAIFGALALVAALAGSATAANRPLVAVLRGVNEVPGPGDANGRGVALIRRVAVDNGTDKVCWFIIVNKIALPATGAHIHVGAAGASGNIVVPLGNPAKKAPVMGRARRDGARLHGSGDRDVHGRAARRDLGEPVRLLRQRSYVGVPGRRDPRPAQVTRISRRRTNHTAARTPRVQAGAFLCPADHTAADPLH